MERPILAYTSQTLNQTTEQLIVVPVEGQEIDWTHTLADFAIDDQRGAAWLFDQDAQTIVAALFDATLWTVEGARAFLQSASALLSILVLAEQPTLLGQSPTPATVEYLRKLIELMRPHVGDDEFAAAVRTARAHAGGKLRSRSAPVEGEPDAALSLSRSSHQFAVAPAPSDTQPYVDPDTGYIWKPILRAATVYNWRGEALTITPDILASLVASFGKAVEHVDIPLGHNPERDGDTPELNTGYIRALDLRDGGQTLWAAFDFTDAAIRLKVMEGSIANVSVWIESNFQDLNIPGKVWAWVLWHVALTNKPQMTKLAPFARISTMLAQGKPTDAVQTLTAPLYDVHEETTMAFATGDTVTTSGGVTGTVGEITEGTFYQVANGDGEVVGWFPEGELTAGEGVAEPEMTQAQAQAFARSMGVSVGELRRFRQERDSLRDRSRTQEISRIVAAMQGAGKHEGVVQIEGTVHQPVVVTAVETLLKEQPAKLRLSASLDGTVTGLDDAILTLINAIPQEARLSLKQPDVPVYERKPGDAPTKDEIAELNAFVQQ
jgi:hypothetical protein